MDPTAERIFEVSDKIFTEQKDFAAALGVSASLVSQWRKGITKSFVKYLPQIAEVLNTTVQWLITGEGEKSRQATTPKGSGLSEEFAKLFAKLTPEDQNQIIAEMLKRQLDK